MLRVKLLLIFLSALYSFPSPARSCSTALKKKLIHHTFALIRNIPRVTHRFRSPKNVEDPRLVYIGLGDSAGHSNPAFAVARQILESDPNTRVVFYGGRQEDIGIIEREGLGEHRELSSRGDKEKGLKGKIKTAAALARAMGEAGQAALRERPDAVIVAGGHIAPPLGWTASLGGPQTKVYVISPDQSVGKGNLLVDKTGADRVFTPRGSEAGNRFQAHVEESGMPQLIRLSRNVSDPPPPTKESVENVLVVGGSQGAESINQAVVQMANDFPSVDRFTILAGSPENVESLNKLIEKTPRLDPARFNIVERAMPEDMPSYYEGADVIIGRAGAGLSTEITRAAKPYIAIPHFGSSPRGHQMQNVLPFSKKEGIDSVEYTHHGEGGVIIVDEHKLKGDDFTAALKNRFESLCCGETQKQNRQAMSEELARSAHIVPDNSQRIADTVLRDVHLSRLRRSRQLRERPIWIVGNKESALNTKLLSPQFKNTREVSFSSLEELQKALSDADPKNPPFIVSNLDKSDPNYWDQVQAIEASSLHVLGSGTKAQQKSVNDLETAYALKGAGLPVREKFGYEEESTSLGEHWIEVQSTLTQTAGQSRVVSSQGENTRVLPPSIQAQIEDYTIRAANTLGLKDLSQVKFHYDPQDNTLVISSIEANPLAGNFQSLMNTSNSDGVNPVDFLDNAILSSMDRQTVSGVSGR